jgi:DNA-binding CsgD family transcriptional regulator
MPEDPRVTYVRAKLVRAGCTERQIECWLLRTESAEFLTLQQIGDRCEPPIQPEVVWKHLKRAQAKLRELAELRPGSEAWERLLVHLVPQDIEETEPAGDEEAADEGEVTVGWRHAALQK